MKFRNHYNAVPSKGEKNSGKSMTVPNQGVSIKDNIRRINRGMPVTGVRDVYYDDEDIRMPDLDKMDLAEVEQYMDRAVEIKKIEEDFVKSEQKRKLAEEKAEIKRLKELEKQHQLKQNKEDGQNSI